MKRILIVDDSPVDQRLIAALLEDQDVAISFAANGKEAVESLETHRPDLVLTDMHMPLMNGLELVRHVREHQPALPVILITSKGNEALAVEALEAGAASYVPKKRLADELVSTMNHMIAVARAERDLADVLAWVRHREYSFVFGSEFRHAEALIGYFQRQMREMGMDDEADLLRVGVALQEALANAIEHGNLELSSTLREADGGYQHVAQERRRQPPYCDRRVYITARLTRSHATFNIRDEGRGFDVSALPDPTDPENLEKASGRGLLLIRSFMDQVIFSPMGNEITLVKRIGDPGTSETEPTDENLPTSTWDMASDDAILQVEIVDSILVVSPTEDLGELEYRSLQRALRPVLDVVERGQGISVLLDFEDTNYFGSSAVGLFLRLARRVQRHGGQMALCHLSDTQRTILKTTALDKIWHLFEARDEALAFLAG